MRLSKEDKKNITQGQFKTNEYNMVGIILQAIITIAIIVIWIIALIQKNNILHNVTKILLGLDFLIMAYNNTRVYNRKKVTIIYIIAGVSCIVLGIMDIVGV